MTLFTGKGDDGKTQIFACDQRLSKSSLIAEALGSLDEINSWLGVCKTKVVVKERSQILCDLKKVIDEIQNGLFSVQAELAGADKRVSSVEVVKMESLINEIEKELPPVKSFLIPGGDELSALFDFARTIARRAERTVIKATDAGDIKLENNTLAFLNRLSSLLFALARLTNHRAGIEEKKPSY